MKKTGIGIILLVLIMGFVVASGIGYKVLYGQDRPHIVDHFACSDNCPGPDEDYTVKVYEKVENSVECLVLGGKPSAYIGWGTTHICKVDWFR